MASYSEFGMDMAARCWDAAAGWGFRESHTSLGESDAWTRAVAPPARRSAPLTAVAANSSFREW